MCTTTEVRQYTVNFSRLWFLAPDFFSRQIMGWLHKIKKIKKKRKKRKEKKKEKMKWENDH